MGAYGERVGSVFGIALVTTTTRYALAEAFREDTLYYRCECDGFLRRLDHALISTVTARGGDNGHRHLSFPAHRLAICGNNDCRLWMVSEPLWRERRIQDGKLRAAGIRGWKYRA